MPIQARQGLKVVDSGTGAFDSGMDPFLCCVDSTGLELSNDQYVIDKLLNL